MVIPLFLTIVLLSVNLAKPLELGCGTEQADIIFVLDASGSVGSRNFQTMLQFVVSVIHQFTIAPDQTRVGLLIFSSRVYQQFELKTYENRTSVEKATLGVRYTGGGTNTASALEHVRLNSFDVSNGGRPNAKKVVIILTDGRSNSESATIAEAQNLLATGVTVFSIGVGRGPKKSELDAMASDPDEHHSFSLTDFDALDSIVKLLTQKACNDLFPFGDAYGDNNVTGDDVASKVIEVETGIRIGKNSYKKIYVSTNGVMSFSNGFTSWSSKRFESSLSYPVVAGFWSDLVIDPQNIGRLFYNKYVRSANDQTTVVGKASRLVNNYYEINNFQAAVVVVATWYKVAQKADSILFNETITFQMVLCSDGSETYVLLIYSEIGLRRLLDRNYIIGYSLENPPTYFNHLFSNSKLAFEMDTHGDPKRGRLGFWPMKLSEDDGSGLNSGQKCMDWFINEEQSLPKYERWSNSLDCPCFLLWAQFDDRLTVYSDGCYVFAKTVPYSKICCYEGFYLQTKIPEAGSLATYSPILSSAMHETKDKDPKKKCCDESHFCTLYYKARPQGKCYEVPPFDTAIIWGDPHIGTLDGKRYTFNGFGEYTLMKIVSAKETINIQARTDLVTTVSSTSVNATIFSALAGEDNYGASFQIELTPNRQSMDIVINGVYRTTDFETDGNYTLRESNVFAKRTQNKALLITLLSGYSITIGVGVNMLTMKISVPNKFKNLPVGLMGNFDGNPDNDLMAPDGTVLNANSSEKEIYYNFGKKWQVTPSESIFTYPTGKSAADYSHPSFVPIFADEASSVKKSEAEVVCGGAEHKECIVDYIITGDKGLALQTKEIIVKTIEDNIILYNQVPGISVDKNQIQVTIGVPVTLSFTASDPDKGDSATIVIYDQPKSGFTFDKTTGLAVWNPSDLYPALIRVGAVDTKGATAVPIIIKITMCSGCSDHGVCISETREKTSSTSTYFSLNKCECETGWEGDDCESDKDGCLQGPCHWLQTCTDLTPAEEAKRGRGYECSQCPVGYITVDGKCHDIDECASKPCDQICQNAEGSYQCKCHAGYRLHGGLCQNINECQEGTHDCKQICRDTNGTFTCACHYGYRLLGDGKSCIQDFDVCEMFNLTCEVGCENATGIPRCFCEQGYELESNNQNCTDVNECKRSVSPCDQKCENNIGGFICSCNIGFKLNNDNRTCSACEVPYYGEDCSEICTCGDRSVSCDRESGCICIPGYRGTYCDVNINECVENPNICGSDELLCVDNDGSYTCNCLNGYRKRADGTCEDINECESAILNDCDEATAKCINTVGSYSCYCKMGFTKGDNDTCVDINECTFRIDGCEQKCENFNGTYQCDCKPGFTLEADRKRCLKIAEPCKDQFTINCGYACEVKEINGTDSAVCYCPRHYKLDVDGVTCMDINECKTNETNLCTYGERCVNTDGSYTCSCPNGNKLENNKRSCTECDSNHWGQNCVNDCACGRGATTCDKLTGCVCKSGWTGTHCSIDVNECAVAVNCSENFECINIPGSYHCACTGGFLLNSTSGRCEDINECGEEEVNQCQYKSTCVNTKGNYTCSCPEDYNLEENGRSCRASRSTGKNEKWKLIVGLTVGLAIAVLCVLIFLLLVHFKRKSKKTEKSDDPPIQNEPSYSSAGKPSSTTDVDFSKGWVSSSVNKGFNEN